jgi:shikimate dehydrogenase
MQIRATSRLLAVIGDPVVHSLSPAMHNAAIAALGLDAVFVALRCGAEAFETVVQGLLAAGGAASITVPHKRAAAELVDEPSDLVHRTGACNTIWAHDGAIAGDNTDVAGVDDELQRLVGGREVRHAVVLGTGGSARAVAVAIAGRWPEAEVAAASRDAARRAQFEKWAGEAGVRVWGLEVGEMNGADLVVNATPLGLTADDPLPVDGQVLERLRPAAVLDLVYARGETRLVRGARARGIRAADGRGVLVGQGAAAFRRFFHVDPPMEIMRGAVEDGLRA